MKGAICGTLTAIGSFVCIIASELPFIPHDTAWRIVGLTCVCAGVFPMIVECLRRAE